jgi:hypothetical protein
MSINADKPQRWKEDIARSVDQFNAWFMKFAPKAYRDTRGKTTADVEQALLLSKDLKSLNRHAIKANPDILPTLRMCCCPPIARDRLAGLAHVNKSLLLTLEKGKVPLRTTATVLDSSLERIVKVISRMLDTDIFPWLTANILATEIARHRASTIVADRLCGAISDPIVRNAHQKRQLDSLAAYLKKKGYVPKSHPASRPLAEMDTGTFTPINVFVGQARKLKIPIDLVIQPKRPTPSQLPVLIEAKSAGDYANVNKRRKEEATKMHQLKDTYGPGIRYILFLCGYFDAGYLGYEAAEGIDWIWEHRIEDLEQLGI